MNAKKSFIKMPGTEIVRKVFEFSFLLLVLALTACESTDNQADAFGNFEADTRYVFAEVNGKLNTFEVEEGGLIAKGQIIGRIDTTQLHLKKGQLKASVNALKSQLQNVPVQLGSLEERKAILEKEVKRTRSLLADSAATQKQLDDLTGELKVVEKQLEATKSQLSTANRSILAQIDPITWQIKQVDDQIDKSTITSPINSTVLEKFKEPGELVMTGQPLLKIANLEKMTLRAFVAENQLSLLKLGGEVTIKTDQQDETLKEYPAKVSWISSEAEFTPKVIQTKEERVNLVYAVKFSVKNDGSLKIGMPGEVHF